MPEVTTRSPVLTSAVPGHVLEAASGRRPCPTTTPWARVRSTSPAAAALRSMMSCTLARARRRQDHPADDAGRRNARPCRRPAPASCPCRASWCGTRGWRRWRSPSPAWSRTRSRFLRSSSSCSTRVCPASARSRCSATSSCDTRCLSVVVLAADLPQVHVVLPGRRAPRRCRRWPRAAPRPSRRRSTSSSMGTPRRGLHLRGDEDEVRRR